jgi:hypothetical protein
VSEPRQERSRGPLVAAAVAALVTAIGIGAVLANREPETASPLDRATAFWTAVSAGHRETAVSYLDPDAADSREASPFGRAFTLERQFDWYEVTGWQWTLHECLEVDDGGIECRVSARNDWSDAIGLEPIVGVHVMEFGDEGITAVIDKDENFRSQWIPLSFEVFAGWVETHHPEDAVIMFGDDDVNQQILDRYRINTDRFVAAYPGQ